MQSNSPALVLSRRIRKTPFEERVFENGVKAFTTYNHMPLASCYSTPQEDYDHLCEYVQIWDVACERQVEVNGPDALKLVELVTPRDISKCHDGECMYIPLVDENGGIVNDPILLRLAQDRYWISIADSGPGVLLWLRGIAYGRNYDVKIFEPDVSPLAVQGPRADDVMAKVIGEHVRDVKFYWYIKAEIAGTDVIVARSGWSGQGGFEIYLQDFSKGLDLWDEIWEAGQEFNIRAGCPNLIDRIERGLMSYGSDITMENNPYECGLDRFFSDTKDAEYLSAPALGKIRKEGVKRHLVYLSIEGNALTSPRSTWDVLDADKNVVGIVTSSAYSAKLGSNISFATIDAQVDQNEENLFVDLGDGELRRAKATKKFGNKLKASDVISKVA